MKRLILGLMMLACSGAEQLDTAECGAEFPDPAGTEEKLLQFNPYGSHGEMSEMWGVMNCALTRVRRATCLDADLTLNTIEHRIRWAPDEEMPNGSSGYISGSNWDQQRIRLRWSMPETHRCPVLTHEIIHALRKSYSHPCPEFSMSYPVTSASQSKITQCDLDIICAKYDCGCQVPESP